MTKPRNLSILLVEDSEEDFYTTKRALSVLGLTATLVRCDTVNSGLHHLQTCREHHSELPHVVLLDLNLPGRGGVDLLKEIKRNPDFALVPVVILTSSAYSIDVEQCYREGASGYIQKSANLDDYYDALKAFYSYWAQTVVLPVRENVT